MGFTISGIREIRELRSGLLRRARTAEYTAVAEYSGLWGWDVMPGAHIVRGSGGRAECSCSSVGCATPGAHPLEGAPTVPAGATLDEATALWKPCPGAALLLPVGRTFDVIEVARSAGHRALIRLERMGLPLGPVAATPQGRAWFFVAPGAAAQLPRLLYRMGWDDAGLDLHGLGPGCHITAPPSDLAGLGPVRWLRPPTLDTAGHPPEARLLLGTLAYVSHRAASCG